MVSGMGPPGGGRAPWRSLAVAVEASTTWGSLYKPWLYLIVDARNPG